MGERITNASLPGGTRPIPIRTYIFTVVLLCSCCLLRPVGIAEADERSSTSLRIGFIAPLTGPVAARGVAAKNGFELGLTDILNPNVTAIYEDDQFKPTNSVTAFRKLVDTEQVNLVICLGSAPCAAIAPLASKYQVPLIAWASDERVSRDNPWVVRINPSAVPQAEVVAEEATRRGYSRVGIFVSSNDYPLAFQSAFLSRFPTAKIAFSEEVGPESRDFRAVMERNRKNKPDAICLCVSPGQVGILARQLRESGFYDQPIFGCETMQSQSEIRDAGGVLDGAWFTWARVDPSFLLRYDEKFKKTDVVTTAASYFDLAHLLRKLAQHPHRKDQLIPSLVSSHVENGALGSYGFRADDTQNYVVLPLEILRVHGEKIE